jgi:nicotinate-nucleotide pyrophosphorylase
MKGHSMVEWDGGVKKEKVEKKKETEINSVETGCVVSRAEGPASMSEEE